MRAALRPILTGMDSDASLLISRMTEPPTTARRKLISDTVKRLKAAGIWSKLDGLTILAAHDAQAARIDWINPSRIASIAGTIAFTANQGYAGNGSDGTLNLGYPLTALANYAQDSATMGCWSRSDVEGSQADIGTSAAFVIGRVTGTLLVRANAAASDTETTADSLGFYGFTRRNSADFDTWKNGATLSTETRASTTIGAGNVRIGSAGGGAPFSTRQIAAGVVGGALSTTEIAALYTILGLYMTAVGAA